MLSQNITTPRKCRCIFTVYFFMFQVFCYSQVPSEEQIKDLLRKKNYKEAISLAEELQGEGEMTNEMLSFVHAQVGFLLLFDLHFEEAIDQFLLSDTMHPSEVFPFIMREPNRWSLLVCATSSLVYILRFFIFFSFNRKLQI